MLSIRTIESNVYQRQHSVFLFIVNIGAQIKKEIKFPFDMTSYRVKIHNSMQIFQVNKEHGSLNVYCSCH